MVSSCRHLCPSFAGNDPFGTHRNPNSLPGDVANAAVPNGDSPPPRVVMGQFSLFSSQLVPFWDPGQTTVPSCGSDSASPATQRQSAIRPAPPALRPRPPRHKPRPSPPRLPVPRAPPRAVEASRSGRVNAACLRTHERSAAPPRARGGWTPDLGEPLPAHAGRAAGPPGALQLPASPPLGDSAAVTFLCPRTLQGLFHSAWAPRRSGGGGRCGR